MSLTKNTGMLNCLEISETSKSIFFLKIGNFRDYKKRCKIKTKNIHNYLVIHLCQQPLQLSLKWSRMKTWLSHSWRKNPHYFALQSIHTQALLGLPCMILSLGTNTVQLAVIIFFVWFGLCFVCFCAYSFVFFL